jgi:hypothetical protein
MDTNKVKKLAKDLAKDFPRSPREKLGGYVIAARTLDKCRATLAGTPGEYHFDCPLDNFFFSFTEISADQFKICVAAGASDEEVAKWIEQKAKQRSRVEIIKWNNDWRYKRLSKCETRSRNLWKNTSRSLCLWSSDTTSTISLISTTLKRSESDHRGRRSLRDGRGKSAGI